MHFGGYYPLLTIIQSRRSVVIIFHLKHSKTIYGHPKTNPLVMNVTHGLWKRLQVQRLVNILK